MKKYFSICAIALASCTSNSNSNKAADSVKVDTENNAAMKTPVQDMEYCFMRTDGTDNQDTTAIHLLQKGSKITGEMKWLPKEKDSRKGTLTGTISGDEITAVWNFMQEGTKDSTQLAFKLTAQQLAQKPLKVNAADGRQTTDTNAGYTLIYQLDNCSQFKSGNKPAL
ncbi:hypothetical protein [Mucilaginibacter sp.]|uniref:hypothetical protein n=1 Tax=Mucilaginibacter sp. TaxID=1882438 RepID=UPI000CC2D3CF|nr:hypothetical protein [Mucilaginibacter sp.]PLW89583.1 MAG: hypothetical protein C0154_10830 [Mucilaginibacter sp.]HEK19301.1 hypothetical protein [Bacteroidota bacterium]